MMIVGRRPNLSLTIPQGTAVQNCAKQKAAASNPAW
jgi:hypothetical protein